MKIIFNFIVFRRSYRKDEEAINCYQEEIGTRRERRKTTRMNTYWFCFPRLDQWKRCKEHVFNLCDCRNYKELILCSLSAIAYWSTSVFERREGKTRLYTVWNLIVGVHVPLSRPVWLKKKNNTIKLVSGKERLWMLNYDYIVLPCVT